MIFKNPNGTRFTIDQFIQRAVDYIKSDSNYRYEFVVACDSKPGSDKTKYSRSMYVRGYTDTVGKGGIIVVNTEIEIVPRYLRGKDNWLKLMKHRLMKECATSIKIMESIDKSEIPSLLRHEDIIIDLDVSETGESRVIKNEMTGWVSGMGYTYRIKPESVGAYCVADKFSRW